MKTNKKGACPKAAPDFISIFRIAFSAGETGKLFQIIVAFVCRSSGQFR
jgi:hypothetical protein